MLNADTELFDKFATYRKRSVGSTVSATGPVPVGAGNPAEDRPPVTGSMAKVETSFEPLLTTNRNCPLGSTVSAEGVASVVLKGDPATGLRAPDESIA